jgi:hypothetical protein
MLLYEGVNGNNWAFVIKHIHVVNTDSKPMHVGNKVSQKRKVFNLAFGMKCEYRITDNHSTNNCWLEPIK